MERIKEKIKNLKLKKVSKQNRLKELKQNFSVNIKQIKIINIEIDIIDLEIQIENMNIKIETLKT